MCVCVFGEKQKLSAHHVAAPAADTASAFLFRPHSHLYFDTIAIYIYHLLLERELMMVLVGFLIDLYVHSALIDMRHNCITMRNVY